MLPKDRRRGGNCRWKISPRFQSVIVVCTGWLGDHTGTVNNDVTCLRHAGGSATIADVAVASLPSPDFAAPRAGSLVMKMDLPRVHFPKHCSSVHGGNMLEEPGAASSRETSRATPETCQHLIYIYI